MLMVQLSTFYHLYLENLLRSHGLVMTPSQMIDLFSGDTRWNWGRISRDEATKRIVEDGGEGTFLVRMSETKSDTYTISVK